MRIWRRKRTEKFAPFNRAALPTAPPLTFSESFAEGLLVAESAARMALKNRIIVRALRGDEPFDLGRAAAEAREVLYELVQQTDEVAEWSAAERAAAARRDGRAASEHDYRRADSRNLRLREQVNEAVGKRLEELRGDDEYLATLAEGARDAAWVEVSREIDARLDREWPDIEVDETYLNEREDRMRDLSLELEREVREVVRRREERDELDDAFGSWG